MTSRERRTRLALSNAIDSEWDNVCCNWGRTMNSESAEVRAARLLRAFFERHESARENARTVSAGGVVEPSANDIARPAKRHAPWPLPWQSA